MSWSFAFGGHYICACDPTASSMFEATGSLFSNGIRTSIQQIEQKQKLKSVRSTWRTFAALAGLRIVGSCSYSLLCPARPKVRDYQQSAETPKHRTKCGCCTK